MRSHQQGSTLTRRLATLLAGVGTIATIVGAGAGIAYAASPVSDYASYPAPLPSGCPAGSSALQGLSFDNGRGDTASTLSDLDVRHGDTVTMSWTGFAEACTTGTGAPAITVSLAAYDSRTATFDPSVDQKLQPGWASCGPDASPCTTTGGRMRLSITLPGSGVCNVQLDAVQGLPLAIVGPSGSYYSDWQRGDGTSRLISAANFGLEPCVAASPTSAPPAVTTTTEAPTTVDVSGPPTSGPTVTQPPTTSTVMSAGVDTPEGPGTSVPATVNTAPQSEAVAPAATAPAPTTTAPSTTSTTSLTKVLDAFVTAPSVAPATVRAAALPVTGSDTSGTLRLAAWLTGAGLTALLAASLLQLQRRRQV